MMLSKKTELLLRNFATINQSIVIKPGNILTSIHPQGLITTKAKVEEEFPIQADIYSIPSLLGMISSLTEPELTWKDNHVLIKGKEGNFKYFYANKGILKYFDGNIPEHELITEIDLREKTVKSLVKASAIIGTNDLSIGCVHGDISLSIQDSKKTTLNTFDVQVGKSDKEFDVRFDMSHMNLIPSDYKVRLCKREGKNRTVLFGVFESELVQYVIASKPESKG